jgi:hypothetical protein
MSFLLDQKGLKNQGPTEICLINLKNSLEIIFFNGIFSIDPRRQISEWPFLKIIINLCALCAFFVSLWLNVLWLKKHGYPACFLGLGNMED